jgi:hypothetical protein
MKHYLFGKEQRVVNFSTGQQCESCWGKVSVANYSGLDRVVYFGRDRLLEIHVVGEGER